MNIAPNAIIQSPRIKGHIRIGEFNGTSSYVSGGVEKQLVFMTDIHFEGNVKSDANENVSVS